MDRASGRSQQTDLQRGLSPCCRSWRSTPLETAARLRQKYGVTLTPDARQRLPREALDEIWGDR